MTMKKIGILSKNYAAKRLFLNKIGECQYKDIRFYNWYLWKNAHLWFLRAIGKLNMTQKKLLQNCFMITKRLPQLVVMYSISLILLIILIPPIGLLA